MLTLAVLGNRIRAALRRIAVFYSKNFADRRTDREKGVRARARGIVQARYRAKGRARGRFEGAALVAPFVTKLVLNDFPRIGLLVVFASVRATLIAAFEAAWTLDRMELR